jgi:hypothetical protein
MQKLEFENALKRVAEFGCAENVDWMFDQYGVRVSQKGLDEAVGAALERGHTQVVSTLRARACVPS